jgi:hypothetical protein
MNSGNFHKIKFSKFFEKYFYFRICLRDLKDKDHLLLPCFLADHDNSNTAGSGQPPSSTDESQFSQQVDIATPIILRQQPSSPARFVPSSVPSMRSMNTEKNEPIFVPIINQSDSSVNIGKRLSSINSCLTEKQKEKLRTRHGIPLLCDDNSNTQSNSCTTDTPNGHHQLRHKRLTTGLSLFKQSVSNPSQENQPTKTNEEDVPEESPMSKKLRRSCRPSISANTRTKRTNSSSSSNDLITSNIPSIVIESVTEQIKKHPIKSILKRLSPTKPRQDHSRRVAFHDQVKVLVFASPLRRDLIAQLKKKSPNKDEFKSPTRIIPKENLPLRKQPTSARCLSVMNNIEQIIPPSPINYNKTRSSKLFHPNDALADWTQSHEICQVNFNSIIIVFCVVYSTVEWSLLSPVGIFDS